MKTARISSLIALVLAAATLTACEDATNVGADLVGAQGGQPEAKEIVVNDLNTLPIRRPSNVAPRLLAGQVDDPVLGAYTVNGYMDITAVTSADFRAGTVESVALHLVPTYVYGDTTSEVTLAYREITEDWSGDGLPTDTSFSVGPVIGEITFTPTDSVVVIDLPDEWVEDHIDEFKSTDLGALFHGFRFDPVAGNAVVGFGPSGSSLIANTSDETSTSPVGRTYPRVERTDAPTLPENLVLMQAGAGPHLTFDLPISATLEPSAVNRASVVFRVDTLYLDQDLSPGFVRPMLRTLDLYGVTDSEASILLARSTLNDDASFVFESAALARALQNELLDQVQYERFELRIPFPDPNSLTGATLYYYTSLNPVVFYNASSTDRAPAAYLTITPLD